MAKTVAQAAVAFANAPNVIRAEIKKSVQVAGLLLAQSARSAQPASGMLRNVGQFGAPVGAKSDVRGNARPTALIKATGPLHLLDFPTRAHTITARRRKMLKLPGGFARSVRVPGTKGKRTFAKGIAKGLPAARSLVEDAFRRAPRLF